MISSAAGSPRDHLLMAVCNAEVKTPVQIDPRYRLKVGAGLYPDESRR
jgi:hypothetical protein